MTSPAPSARGVLEVTPKGGFLRNPARSYLPTTADPLVSTPAIRKLGLRAGLMLSGPVEPARGNNPPKVTTVAEIEDAPVENYRPRAFEELTAVDPTVMLKLETGREPLTTRVMDLLTPIGKGTRGLIVAPPRTGKTILLQHIAQAVVANEPSMRVILLLVDERPEEVTEIRTLFRGNARVDVIASSSDNDSANHIRVASLCVERAKRLVEQGQEVFILLDSLTRLARAFNRDTKGTGRTISGGLDARALEEPKKLFGSARAFEEGGSLTVLGTALIETGSRMDDVIFQEFKGTGNMELVLDRKLADRRIFPAIDIAASGTRKEEKLLGPDVVRKTTMLRRTVIDLPPVQAMEMLNSRLATFASNAAFLDKIAVAG